MNWPSQMRYLPAAPRERANRLYKCIEFFVKTLIACLIWLLIVATSAYIVIQHSQIPAQPWIKHDPRIGQLAAFMDKHKFAQPYYAKEYIQSADRSHDDYRLLVAISLAESSGCKHYLYDDCWGFGSSSGLVHFASVPEGIAYISNKLGTDPLYAGKSNLEKARIYGPHSNPNYGPTIIRYMNEIQ